MKQSVVPCQSWNRVVGDVERRKGIWLTGATTVVVCGIALKHEHADEYATALEHAEGYVGIATPVCVTG